MPQRSRLTAAEQALVTKIEKAGASFETNRRGKGFINAGDKALKLIKGIDGVQFLDLFEACDSDEVSDEGLAHVKGMTDLRYLALGPGISDKGLSHLAALTELRELRLDSARDVTDAGLKHLQHLANLQSLSLQYTDVGGKGLVHLFGLTKLKELNLDGTPVTPEAVESLRKAMPKCKVTSENAKPAASTPKKAPKKEQRTDGTGTGYQLTLRTELRGHADKPTYAAFSQDGALLATVGTKILLWDGTNGKKLRPISFKQGALWGAAFTPDGKWFASGSNGGCVFVWDTASGKEKLCLEGATPVFTAVDIDSTGKFLAAGGDDGKIYLWELPKGKLLQAFPATAGDFFSDVAFSPDGKTLASCGRDSFVSVWNIPSCKKATDLQGPAHTNQYQMIRDVSFSPDGETLAVTHADQHVRIWSLSQRKELSEIPCPTPPFRVAFHPGGQLLATASDGDSLVRLWGIASGKCVIEFPTQADWNSVNVIRFSPDGKSLVTNGKGGSLLLLDLKAG